MIQYIIIAIILAACVTYAAICIYRSIKQARECKNYQCSGCPFVKKCQKNKKKELLNGKNKSSSHKELLKLLLLSCNEETRQKIKHFRTRSL